MRIGTHMTRKGQPLDHTPSIHPDTLKWSPMTSKESDTGITYFRVHFGPYDAPRTQWVREDNIIHNPRYRGGNFDVHPKANPRRK